MNVFSDKGKFAQRYGLVRTIRPVSNAGDSPPPVHEPEVSAVSKLRLDYMARLVSDALEQNHSVLLVGLSTSVSYYCDYSAVGK